MGFLCIQQDGPRQPQNAYIFILYVNFHDFYELKWECVKAGICYENKWMARKTPYQRYDGHWNSIVSNNCYGLFGGNLVCICIGLAVT